MEDSDQKETNGLTVEFEPVGEMVEEEGVEEMVEERLSVFDKLIPGLVDKLVDENVKQIQLPPRPCTGSSSSTSSSSSSSSGSSSSLNSPPPLHVGRETMVFQVWKKTKKKKKKKKILH